MANPGLFPHIKNLFRESLINKSHFILLEGYKLMKLQNIPFLYEMEEDNITANLVRYMIQVDDDLGPQFTITPQFPIYNVGVYTGQMKAIASPVIDIRMTCTTSSKKFDYYIEAKNLSENNWRKSTGAGVDSSYYNNRYIKTGIDHFIKEYYPQGCLVGYIVKGESTAIITKLNKRLQALLRDSERIVYAGELCGLSNCYMSKHNVEEHEYIIKHFFLQLA